MSKVSQPFLAPSFLVPSLLAPSLMVTLVGLPATAQSNGLQSNVFQSNSFLDDSLTSIDLSSIDLSTGEITIDLPTGSIPTELPPSIPIFSPQGSSSPFPSLPTSIPIFTPGGATSDFPGLPDFPPVSIPQGPLPETPSTSPDAPEASQSEGVLGRISDLFRRSPLGEALSKLREGLREQLKSPAFGIFTRNRVVKRRDQANLIDQELARLMADPYLGEKGNEWIAQTMEGTTTALGGGLESANAAIQLSAEAQALTSTQDVAKAVAQQGGQNAVISASILQLQAQNQASLLQLQRLISSSIQLSANNSEAIDENNRRERIERANELRRTSSELIFIPGVFQDPSELSN